MKYIIRIVFLVLFFFTVACKEKVTQLKHGAYIWKNDIYRLYDEEGHFIKTHNISKLYVKFFEVSLEDGVVPIPIAKSDLRIDSSEVVRNPFLSKINLVPTIYIYNEVFKDCTDEDIQKLASNIIFLVNKRKQENYPTSIQTNELQIDCDWTPSTKESYFQFLEEIKNYTSLKLSCTLRLYPYKYQENMGIPPVDRVNLMCYNLISPLQNPNKNSILDVQELNAYFSKHSDYPLPMDITLPIYNRVFVYRDGRLIQTMNDESVLNETDYLEQKSELWFQVSHTFSSYSDFHFLKKGDILKMEVVKPKSLLAALKILQKHIEFDSESTISIFHLSSETIRNYTNDEIHSIYTFIH